MSSVLDANDLIKAACSALYGKYGGGHGGAGRARLLRKRLRGITPIQVDLAGQMLTHCRVGKDGY